MIPSGNHERDWSGLGSFYGNMDSGGECGVLAENIFYVPTKNNTKFWYSTDYGMFHFCIADKEHDGREGTEQHKFIEHCSASVDRQKQPWLSFLAHRVRGYSSCISYAEGSFDAPMGRESLPKLWQKYKEQAYDLNFYYDHGFVKLTAFDHSNLLFEYKKSRDGQVYDSFRISRSIGTSWPALLIVVQKQRIMNWIESKYL